MTNSRELPIRTTLSTLTLALVASLASDARAQAGGTDAPPNKADEVMDARQRAFDEAVAAMARRDWGECRVKTLGAWAVKKDATIAGLAGVCEVELELYRDAAEHLHFAMANGEGEVAGRGPQVKAAYEKALTRVGALDFSSTPAGAELRLQGQLVGVAPAMVFVDPGKHAFEARIDGHESKTESIELAAGEKKVLSLRLNPIDGATRPPLDPPDDEPRKRRPAWPAFVLGGVAAVGVGVGITGFVVAGGARSSAEETVAAVGPRGCGVDGSACASLGVGDELDRQDTFRGLGIGGFALGGARLTGMILYLVLPESESRSTGLRIAPSFGEAQGLILGGTF